MNTPKTIEEILKELVKDTYIVIEPEVRNSYATTISRLKRSGSSERYRIRSDKKDLTVIKVWRVK